MTDLRELMHAAADTAPSPAGMADGALRLHRRRQRRARTALATVLAVAALGGFVVALGEDDDDGVYVALGADGVIVGASERDCRIGFAGKTSATSLPQRMRLVSERPGLRLELSIAREESMGCAPAPVALALADVAADGTYRRLLTLEGPLPGPLDLDGAERIAVRGTTGRVWSPFDLPSGVAWTDADGRSWALRASGLTEPELLATAGRLDLSGPRPRLVDPGYEDTTPTGVYGTATRRWDVTYVEPSGRQITVDGVEGRTPSTATLAGSPIENFRRVRVRGTTGVVASNGVGLGDALQTLIWPIAPGIQGQVGAVGATPEELVAIADGLREAGPGNEAVLQAD